MNQKPLGLPKLLIITGSCMFIFVLWLSAYLEPDIRWLHFFQAWMYVITILLVLQGNRWGYFIGFSAAVFWDYINVFVTNFFASGLRWVGAWITTGDFQRLDQMVSVPGWIGNLLVVTGCIWGYAQLAGKRVRDMGAAAIAFVMTTAFFAVAIAICQPRYLPLFRAALHPHAPW